MSSKQQILLDFRKKSRSIPPMKPSRTASVKKPVKPPKPSVKPLSSLEIQYKRQGVRLDPKMLKKVMAQQYRQYKKEQEQEEAKPDPRRFGRRFKW